MKQLSPFEKMFDFIRLQFPNQITHTKIGGIIGKKCPNLSFDTQLACVATGLVSSALKTGMF